MVVGHNLRDNHSDHDFNCLLVKYTPIIFYICKHLGFFQKWHYHEGLELEDAYQAGCIGLWQAQVQFDPSKVQKDARDPFASFAYSKIRSAILDEIRRCSWVKSARHHPRVHIRHSGGDIVGTEGGHGEDLLESLIQEEDYERVAKEIDEMDFNRRNVFYGWMLHQQPAKELGKKQDKKNPADLRCVDREQVADVLGISSNRVYQLRSDIRQKLRTIH